MVKILSFVLLFGPIQAQKLRDSVHIRRQNGLSGAGNPGFPNNSVSAIQTSESLSLDLRHTVSSSATDTVDMLSSDLSNINLPQSTSSTRELAGDPLPIVSSTSTSSSTYIPTSITTATSTTVYVLTSILGSSSHLSSLATSSATTVYDGTLPSQPGSSLSDNQTITYSGNLTCVGDVTYVNNIPETEFVTVTEGFDVTVTATNATHTEHETIVSPPPVCFMTIISLVASGLVDTTAKSNGIHRSIPSEIAPAVTLVTLTSTIPEIFSSADASATSTVTVTKKTPVLVVSTTSKPPVFQPPPSSISTSKSSSKDDRGNPLPTTTSVNNGLNGIILPTDSDNLITTTIANVGIVIAPSTIVIGTQTVKIPASSETMVAAGSTTFTVRASEIIGPSTTIAIQAAAVTPISTVITAAGGIVVTIGQSTAVVAGTTFRVGAGASETSIVMSGQTISVGPNGVGLPSTTIAPVRNTNTDSGSPFVVQTAGGGLIISIDATEAVISATTYRIGAGAGTVVRTVVVDGQTISIGPFGVGLASTTIRPTSKSGMVTTSSGSGSGSPPGSKSTATPSSAVLQANAATGPIYPPAHDIFWSALGLIFGIVLR